MKLSVIIPYCVEYPQIEFTVNALWCELRSLPHVGHDFEIILVDNWCDEAASQTLRPPAGLRKFPYPNKEIWQNFIDNYGNRIKAALTLHPELQEPYAEELDKLQIQLNQGYDIYRTQDPGTPRMKELSGGCRPWLKYITYTDKLSHWQAKNAGVAASTGDILFFCDGHIIPSQGSIRKAFFYYAEAYEKLNGTLHIPIAYMMERQGGELIYKFKGGMSEKDVQDYNKKKNTVLPFKSITAREAGDYHYSFTKYRPPKDDRPFKVPCMSTCFMFMHREIYNLIGGWPVELGVYGGGEHFINYTFAILGKNIWIYPGEPCYHYANKYISRGYNWYHDDYIRNRIIATYMFGGHDIAKKYTQFRADVGDKYFVLSDMLTDISKNNICREHRKKIRQNQIMSIEDWHDKVLPELIK